MKAGRIAGNFSRDRQLNDSTRGCRRRGGRRFGAGRKKGCGRWGEETIVMRVPKSQVEQVKVFLESLKPIEMI
jgi:hypothetical protein